MLLSPCYHHSHDHDEQLVYSKIGYDALMTRGVGEANSWRISSSPAVSLNMLRDIPAFYDFLFDVFRDNNSILWVSCSARMIM